jgi:hypothetical protein
MDQTHQPEVTGSGEIDRKGLALCKRRSANTSRAVEGGADPVSPGARFGANDRTLPRLQAADSISRQ